MKFIKTHRSPNFSRGRVIDPTGIIFHHTAGRFAGSLDWVTRKESGVSYHYMIDMNGDIYEIVDPTRRAWHAGVSLFNGRNDCNSFMIGIAFGGNTNQRDLTMNEHESARNLVRYLQGIFPAITPDRVTDHRSVSPGRKDDLKKSEFERLHAFIFPRENPSEALRKTQFVIPKKSV